MVEENTVTTITPEGQNGTGVSAADQSTSVEEVVQHISIKKSM